MFYKYLIPIIFICIITASNIFINWHYLQESTLIFNSLGIFFHLVGIQMFASRNMLFANGVLSYILVYLWVFLEFSFLILSSFFFMLEYYQKSIIYLVVGELLKILGYVLGIFVWFRNNEYYEIKLYQYGIFVIGFIILYGLQLAFYDTYYYIPISENNKNLQEKLIDISIITLSLYPYILLVLRYFQSWLILAIFLIISSIIEIIYSYPTFLWFNNMCILSSLLILFVHYPENRQNHQNRQNRRENQIVNTTVNHLETV